MSRLQNDFPLRTFLEHPELLNIPKEVNSKSRHCYIFLQLTLCHPRPFQWPRNTRCSYISVFQLDIFHFQLRNMDYKDQKILMSPSFRPQIDRPCWDRRFGTIHCPLTLQTTSRTSSLSIWA